jgi:hypothetical protein
MKRLLLVLALAMLLGTFAKPAVAIDTVPLPERPAANTLYVFLPFGSPLGLFPLVGMR